MWRKSFQNSYLLNLIFATLRVKRAMTPLKIFQPGLTISYIQFWVYSITYGMIVIYCYNIP